MIALLSVLPAPFTWFESTAAQDLGQVLLHTLWQAPLAAAALWLVLKTLPAARARLRSAAAGLALVAVVLAAVVTHAAITLPASLNASNTPTPVANAVTPAAASASAPSGIGGISGTDVPSVVGPTGQLPPAPALTLTPDPIPWSALALTAWALGATLLLLNTFRSVIATRRLTRGPGVAPVEPWAQDVLHDLQKRLRIHRTVRLLTSAAAHTPCVLGALFPVIVLPPALAAGLTTEQLRVVLAHELAHIKRHDYLINLFQRLVEALLFFNPPVWWISRQLRLEREAACDAIAARALDDDRVHVARTLVDVLQQLTPDSRPHPTTAMALGQPHQERPIATRIRRLLHPHLPDAVRLPWPTLLLALSLTAVTLYGVAYGTEATAVAIDKIVNPEKYIADTREQIERGTLIERAYRFDDKEGFPAASLVRIAGTLTTYDGEPVPSGKLTLNLVVETPFSSVFRGGEILRVDDDPASLRFNREAVNPGTLRLIARAPGYGVLLTDPIPVLPGEDQTNLHFILPEGFTVPVRIRDAQDKPVANARIDVTYWQGDNRTHHDDYQSDANGVASLDHLASQRATARIFAEGFEQKDVEAELKPGESLDVVLRPALPLDGLVTDAVTGRPVNNATVRLIATRENHAIFDPRWSSSPLVARSNAEGEFTLRILDRDARATLWFEAASYAPVVKRDVTPVTGNDAPLNVVLQPALTPEIHVIGTDAQLAALPGYDSNRVRISLQQTLTASGDDETMTSFIADLDLSRQPPRAIFEDPILEGQAVFHISNAEGQGVEVQDIRAAVARGPILIPLAPEANDAPTRSVILNFPAPKGWPPATGTVEVAFRRNAEPNGSEWSTYPVTDGRVVLDVPLCSGQRVSINRFKAPGYWLPVPNVPSDRPSLEVFAGDGPLTQDYPLRPAGLVTGRVVDDDGNALPYARLFLAEVEPNPQGKIDPALWSNRYADVEGRFLITPLPFGGSYRIHADIDEIHSLRHGVSAPITATAEAPHPETEVVIPLGVDVDVQVLAPEGDPVPGLKIGTDAEISGWYSQHSDDFVTDHEGRVTLKGLNFDLPDTPWFLRIPQTGRLLAQRLRMHPGDSPIIVRLEEGITAEVQVIEQSTGQPVAGLEVFCIVHDEDKPRARNLNWIQGSTDTDGKLQFNGLEQDIRYLLLLNANSWTVSRHGTLDDAGKLVESNESSFSGFRATDKLQPQVFEVVPGH